MENLSKDNGVIKFYNVTFTYTFKCNARCAHCMCECGPEKNEKLSVNIVKEALRGLYKMGINNFTVTGGEPFLFFDEIVEILTFAHSLNLKFLIGTNGFWGTSFEDAFNILKTLYLLGLRKLLLSADKYHQEFIKIERLYNILKAAEKIGLRVKITVNMTKSDKESIEIVKKLKSYNCTISLKEPKLVGRALKSVEETELFSFTPTDKWMNISCNQIGFPEITPDGRVWICCGIPSGRYYNNSIERTPLILGNIYVDSLEKILSRNKENVILKILKFYGPIMLTKILERSNKRKYEFRKRYHRICDLCCDILGSIEYVDIIQNNLDKLEITDIMDLRRLR